MDEAQESIADAIRAGQGKHLTFEDALIEGCRVGFTPMELYQMTSYERNVAIAARRYQKEIDIIKTAWWSVRLTAEWKTDGLKSLDAYLPASERAPAPGIPDTIEKARSLGQPI